MVKISKFILAFCIGLILSIFTVQLCEAANSLTCWYAFVGNNETTKGYYLTSNFVGKVVGGSDASHREAAATALIDGMVPWNTNNKALNNLGISLRAIPYASTAVYNVEFLAGNIGYVESCVGAMTPKGIGKTRYGSVSTRHQLSYNSVVREIFAYSANSSTSSNLTKVGIAVDRVSPDKYGIVGAHEIGHVLGWYGHSDSDDIVSIMHPTGGINGTNYNVTSKDLAHIRQFYRLGN